MLRQECKGFDDEVIVRKRGRSLFLLDRAQRQTRRGPAPRGMLIIRLVRGLKAKLCLIPSQCCACVRKQLCGFALSSRNTLRRAHVTVVEANVVLTFGTALLEHHGVLAQRQSARV